MLIYVDDLMVTGSDEECVKFLTALRDRFGCTDWVALMESTDPFSGGMGGGMGDAFGKAQEMMKNPKLMELVSKAQSNPKIMAAMTECMSNPAAMSKYINDPEVGPFMKEFQQYM